VRSIEPVFESDVEVEAAMVEVPVQARSQAPLRLTRRGRLVLLAVVLLLMTALAGLVAAPGLAAGPGDPAGRVAGAPTTLVRPGDTLWAIAQRHAPEREPFETIDEIRRLNRLSGYTVHPGQRLTLPRRL
jgi:hypothetical protein